LKTGKRETFDSFAIKSENKLRTENISSNLNGL